MNSPQYRCWWSIFRNFLQNICLKVWEIQTQRSFFFHEMTWYALRSSQSMKHRFKLHLYVLVVAKLFTSWPCHLYFLFQITCMYLLCTEIRFMLKNCFQILVKTLKMKPISSLNLVVYIWNNKLLGDSNRRIGRVPGRGRGWSD